MALSKIKTNSIEDDAVTATQIAADAVGTSEIAADAVDTSEIAASAVETAEILDANVTLAKIANQAANTVLVRDANSSGVVSAKAVATTEILIGDGTGFTAAALSGDTTMTNAGAVTIADNAVTLAKMAGLARGKIIYGDASGDPAALTVGSSGQALVSDGTDISWGAAGASLTGSTNNTIATVTGANALAGEANFTYDGNTLDIKNDGTASSINLYCESSNAHYTKIKSGPHASATSYTLTLPNAPPTDAGSSFEVAVGGAVTWKRINWPAFGVGMTGSTACPDDAFTKMPFGYDLVVKPAGVFDGTTNYRFTCPAGGAGDYQFYARVRLNKSAGTLNDAGIYIYKNGSNMPQNGRGMFAQWTYNGDSNSSITMQVSNMQPVLVDDYFEVYVYSETSDGNDSTTQGGGSGFFYGWRL